MAARPAVRARGHDRAVIGIDQTTNDALRWFPSLRGNQDARPAATTVFCVPYAGGNAALYRKWRLAAQPAVRVVPVQLPGRMERLDERPMRSARAIADRIGEAVTEVAPAGFAFFGISLGALVAFETTRWLARRGLIAKHLFVVSSPAPTVPRTTPSSVHSGPDEDVVAVLRQLRLTPPEVLADEEMLRMLLPILRADFAVTETYVYEPAEPLRTPVTAIYGTLDSSLDSGAVERWREETTAGFTSHAVDHGHFLLPERSTELLGIVCAALSTQE